jgi:hypothetical protein
MRRTAAFVALALFAGTPVSADGLWPYDDGPQSWMVRPGPHDLFLMPGILHCPAGGGVFGEVDDAVKSIARRYASGTPEAERAATQVLAPRAAGN